MLSFFFAPIRMMGRGCLFGAGCLLGLVVALMLIGIFFGLIEQWVVYLVK